MQSIGVGIRFLAAAPPAASDGRCFSRPLPGRRLVPPVRRCPLFLTITMALPALSGQFRP
jgi:hypothetical protein